jgi:hypothetical protein
MLDPPQLRFWSHITKDNSGSCREPNLDPQSATLKMDSTVLRSKPEQVILAGSTEANCVHIKNTKNVWKFTASVDLSKTSCSGIPKSITHSIPSTLFYATSVHMSNKRRWSIALAVFSIFQPTDMLSTGVSLITTTLPQACANNGQRAACSFYPQISQGFLNIHACVINCVSLWHFILKKTTILGQNL